MLALDIAGAGDLRCRQGAGNQRTSLTAFPFEGKACRKTKLTGREIMKRPCTGRIFFVAALVLSARLVAGLVFRPGPAGAQSINTFVLTADAWGAAQDVAVMKA